VRAGEAEVASFVQIGATRDGLDPYLDCARRRHLRAVLVETPAYLRWRRGLGRRPFDDEVAVEHPDDPQAVRAALEVRRIVPVLLLAGFERYVGCAFATARALGVAPWPAVGAAFVPVDKHGQRTLLAARAGRVRQPAFVRWQPQTPERELARLGFPQVVKPADGGGGLGVFYAADERARAAALAALASTRNYDGAPFAGVLVEQFVPGEEYSIQGLARAGRAIVLSVCEKLTALEPVRDEPGLTGFREIGHIATPGPAAPVEFGQLAQQCLTAMGYREGPFHIDVIRDGRLTFVEMGFRLSGGGLVRLVERATGADWAELTFRAHLREAPSAAPTPAPSAGVVGQVTLVTGDELAFARDLCRSHPNLDISAGAVPGAEPSVEDGRRLASDRLRHTGLARVLAHGDAAAVRDILRACVRERIPA
jgi:hypothetical protein